MPVGPTPAITSIFPPKLKILDRTLLIVALMSLLHLYFTHLVLITSRGCIMLASTNPRERWGTNLQQYELEKYISCLELCIVSPLCQGSRPSQQQCAYHFQHSQYIIIDFSPNPSQPQFGELSYWKLYSLKFTSMVLYPNVKLPNLHILLPLFVWRLPSHSSGFHCQLCVDLQDPSWISSESSLLEDDIEEEVTLLWKLHNFHLIKSSSMDLLFQFSWPLCYEWLCKSLLRNTYKDLSCYTQCETVLCCLG